MLCLLRPYFFSFCWLLSQQTETNNVAVVLAFEKLK
jgi:hypothetical protein